MAKEGKLTEGHFRALLAVQDPEKQYRLALQMIERGVTVRQAEKTAQKKEETVEQMERKQILYRDIEHTFQNFFGTKVRLDAGKRRGKIILNTQAMTI